MLLQSQHDTIVILPALPSKWLAGKATGLRATNAFGVSIYWEEGKLTTAEITSDKGSPCIVSYPGIGTKGVITTAEGVEITPTVINDNTVSFSTAAGDKFVVYPDRDNYTSVQSATATPQSIGVSVAGRTVSLATAAHTRVYDVQGRLAMETDKPVFTVPTSAGHTVILRITTAEDKTTACKVVFR